MNKVAIITDTHLGAKNSNDTFRDYFRRYNKEILFPKLRELGITDLFHGGDFFENRNHLGAKDLDYLVKEFFPLLNEYNVTLHIIPGNHDVAHKNTNDITTSSIFKLCDNIRLYETLTEVQVGDTTFVFVPWITEDNGVDILSGLDKYQNTPDTILLMHADFAGFKMYKSSVAMEGLDPLKFKNFHKILSGHYHHKSTVGNITYLGSPFYLKWNDYDDDRGFHVFDSETKEFEYFLTEWSPFCELTPSSDLEEIFGQSFTPSFIRVRIAKDYEGSDKELATFLEKLSTFPIQETNVVDERVLDFSGVDVVVPENLDDLYPMLTSFFDEQMGKVADKSTYSGLLKNLYDEAESLNE